MFFPFSEGAVHWARKKTSPEIEGCESMDCGEMGVIKTYKFTYNAYCF